MLSQTSDSINAVRWPTMSEKLSGQLTKSLSTKSAMFVATSPVIDDVASSEILYP